MGTYIYTVPRIKSDNRICFIDYLSRNGLLVLQVLRELGCLLYILLDYGIPEDQERTLSLQISNLIEWLINDHERYAIYVHS